jgi:hypothetical protein
MTSGTEQLPLKTGGFGGFLQKIRRSGETCATTNPVVAQIHCFL